MCRKCIKNINLHYFTWIIYEDFILCKDNIFWYSGFPRGQWCWKSRSIVFCTRLIFASIVPASMWRMAGERVPVRGALGRPWRGAPPPPRSSSRPCRSAASPSSTGPTQTSRCLPNLCRGTVRSPAKGEFVNNVTSNNTNASL